MSESAPQQLRAFIERILRLKEEQDTLAADIRDIYAEAKGSGFDKTALGEVVSHLRKVEKKGRDAMDERSALFDMYLSAFEDRPSHTHAREGQPVLMQEPRDEGDGHAGADEHGREEGSHPRLPSDRVENKPGAPAVIAGATNSQSSEPPSSQAETKAEATDLLPGASATLPECSVGGGDDRTSVEEVHNPNLEEGVQQTPSLPDNDFEPPSFLLKSKGPLRPHCLNPDLCAGVGRNHCWSCRKASGLSEVA